MTRSAVTFIPKSGALHALLIMRVLGQAFIVESKVNLELKSSEQLSKAHLKQVLRYLKLKGLMLGFVLNFGPNLMRDGIERVVNGLPEESLGVLASWRETPIEAEPGTEPSAAPPPW